MSAAAYPSPHLLILSCRVLVVYILQTVNMDTEHGDSEGDQDIVVSGGQLTESKAKLHRLNVKLIRNCIWNGTHLFKRRNLQEMIQRAREGRGTRDGLIQRAREGRAIRGEGGAIRAHGTIKSRGGYVPGNIPDKTLFSISTSGEKIISQETWYENYFSGDALLELNFWNAHFTARALGVGAPLRSHGIKPVEAKTTTTAGGRKR